MKRRVDRVKARLLVRLTGMLTPPILEEDPELEESFTAYEVERGHANPPSKTCRHCGQTSVAGWVHAAIGTGFAKCQNPMHLH